MGVTYAREMVRYFVASIVVAVLLTACGSDAAPETFNPIEAASDLGVETAVAFPLEVELGFASEPERRRYQLISRQRLADEAMLQCMEQAGFLYAVRPAEEAFRSGAFVGDGSRAWTQINGLGITVSFIDAVVSEAARETADAVATNLDYVASLTPEQQVDYDRALVGDLRAPTNTSIEPAPGCWEQSYNDIVASVALIDAFAPELSSLNSRLNADPRVIRFQQDWSACMNTAGYSYVNEAALSDDVYARLLDIELVATNGVTQVASPDALDALAALAAFERDVAVAGFDCRLGFADELAQLRSDYEREFLDDNRFRIAELQSPS